MADRQARAMSCYGDADCFRTFYIFPFPLQILHSHIGSAERGQITAAGSPLTISCKSFLSVSFLMSRDKECQDVYDTLNEISQPSKCTLFSQTIRR